MDLGTKSNLRNQCLTLSNNKLIASPKTPNQKLNSLKKRAANTENSPSALTPENRKFINIVEEESPTQNYYEFCTLSQKMLIDEDRDVVWNWEKHKNLSEPRNKVNNSKECRVKAKLLSNINQERKRAKPNYSCKGLYKLQALQKEKKSINKDVQNSLNPLLLNKDKIAEYRTEGREILKESHSKIKSSVDSGIESTSKNSRPDEKSIKDLFCDEDDSILFRHSQKLEICNEHANKAGTSSIQHVQSNKKINRVENLKSESLKKSFPDESQTALQKDDSFDDYFLSIDLSSINDNKRFQRHNSMPSNCNENKSSDARFPRHVSSDDFSKESTSTREALVISPISDITEISVESFDSAASCQVTVNKPTNRCSKEEVEAKRLEAKRKRLLRMNKISK
ncbi:uncharacterized protein LOC129612027 [Condylostylus longicornis]|uniref:uncharacterized protein LOC129612027 n=1 Tax=Condylostylus longicornis TaxID=2530218 RepID=UPI00244E053B|nr:uncharacterized protein LOC129612027 [Condylostylus longicornis]